MIGAVQIGVAATAAPGTAPNAGTSDPNQAHVVTKLARKKPGVPQSSTAAKPGVAAGKKPAVQALDPEQARALQEEQNAQRQQMLEKLESLRRDIAAGEASRSEVADALAHSERAISEANRKLRDLSQQQAAAQNQLMQVQQRRSALGQTIANQQRELARMLHEEYLAGRPDPFRLFFSGEDPNQIQRDFQYQGYVSLAVAGVLEDLQDSLSQARDLSNQVQAHNQELASIATSQEAEHAGLLKEEEARRATLAQISDKLQNQRAQADALTRDEKRLSQVVDELGRLIERQARESRERERQRALAHEKQLREDRLAEKNPAGGSLQEAPQLAGGGSALADRASGTSPSAPAEPPFAGNLLASRGRLRLPVQGELAGRFGGTRSEGGPTWKGLFIRAASGTEVHAIAPGRVVFAEWLRGFGNLLIIDHGDQYLSIYGNNESLLKQPGDIVKMSDVVATVGNSGGNPETGLYFEMRYQGKPFDPMTWVAGR